MGEDRSHFAPVVLLGLGASALAAVASAKPWISTPRADDSVGMTALDEGAKYPLAAAVSLLLLAAWGVLLVTRGRVRRTFAVVATLAAAGLVAAVAAGRATLSPADTDSLARSLGRAADAGWSAWFWVAAVAALVALAAGVLACRLTPRWPEMGRRYDAPAGPDDAVDAPLDSDRDLWRALDEGRDPTQER